MQEEIPLIGLGTYLLQGKECRKAVEMALEVGYRHFDTALAYENQEEIGKAIKRFDREELFITSKFFLDRLTHKEGSVEEICNQVLKQLKIDYIDLLLIHWPDRSYPMEEIFAQLWKEVEKGKIRFPGVSNFTEHHLQNLYDVGLKVPYNQIELHPYLTQKKLLNFCDLNRTRVVAYRSFGKGALLKDPTLQAIGSKHGKTAGQVILRWLIQQNIPVIPKGTSEEHLRENFNVFDFKLDASEILTIDQLDRDLRYCDTNWSDFNY
ncbi:MAG: aldo/keto reductase [Verrucomicrobia bacterium]|nr:aldo/keto reductase [Verrucomicrobiota bacterium]